jgi:hypothetical protein
VDKAEQYYFYTARRGSKTSSLAGASLFHALMPLSGEEKVDEGQGNLMAPK